MTLPDQNTRERFYEDGVLVPSRLFAELDRQRGAAANAIDTVEKIAKSMRDGPRHGVTKREAFFYDKGWDDALKSVRNMLRLSFDDALDETQQRCGCVCHVGVDGQWRAHACGCPGCPSGAAPRETRLGPERD